jgi:squalene-associated FAD-dependent desaturase
VVPGRVGVVGAGLAGLSAGLELKRAGFEVSLFERSRLLGGKATSFELDGTEVDNGQHVYLACCTEFVDFVSSIPGLDGVDSAEPLLHLQDRFDALLLARDHRPARLRAARLPAPLHLAPAILRYRHLSVRDRLRIGVAVTLASRPARRGETFADWLSRHRQREAARRAFWDPFLVPALNAPLENVSADDALFVIRTAFLSSAGASRFGYARVPLARIAEAAAAQLDVVCLRTPVVGLEISSPPHATASPPLNGGGEEEVRSVRLEGGETLEFGGIVLAIPPARLKRVLGEPERFGVFGLDGFEAAPIVDVHLWYNVATVGFEFAALLDSPIQWVFEKGTGYVCCSMSAADAYVSWSNTELVELCNRELVGMIPALAGATLLRGSATRDRDATFVPRPGLRRPGPLTTDPRLVIAGAWTDTGWPATMESAVRSGRAAARALMVQIRGKNLDR